MDRDEQFADFGVLGSQDCVQTYSPAAVDERAFAFDGVVTAIGPSVSGRPGSDDGQPPPPLVGVTFSVQE